MIVINIVKSLFYAIIEQYKIKICRQPNRIYYLYSIEDIKKAHYIVSSENNIVCTRHEYALCFTSLDNEYAMRVKNKCIFYEYNKCYAGNSYTYFEMFLLPNLKEILQIFNNKSRLFCFSWLPKNYIIQSNATLNNSIAVLIPKVYWKRFNIIDMGE